MPQSPARQISPKALSGGVFVSTLTPFDTSGAMLPDAIADQAHRIAAIAGILGIAVNTTVRERLTLTSQERLQIIDKTRAGLAPHQMLLACVGELSEDVIDDVQACCDAGANAIISFPAKWQRGYEGVALETRLYALADIAERLMLPVIVALGGKDVRWASDRNHITALARSSPQILGFDMGGDDDVVQYDQDYYALKSVDRPLACLPSSEGALFHNLTTGADGVLSCLAYVAPHEISGLYKATRENCFPEARAIHNQLAPLIALLNGHDAETREMMYREAAHHRGLLPSAYARGIRDKLSPELRTQIHQTIADIGLKPIAWI